MLLSPSRAAAERDRCRAGNDARISRPDGCDGAPLACGEFL